jgi:hypothetical protein
MPRAAGASRKAGFEVVAVPADFTLAGAKATRSRNGCPAPTTCATRCGLARVAGNCHLPPAGVDMSGTQLRTVRVIIQVVQVGGFVEHAALGMSFDKKYSNRKDRRRPYFGSARYDPCCRPHGRRSWGRDDRLHGTRKRTAEAEAHAEGVAGWGRRVRRFFEPLETDRPLRGTRRGSPVRRPWLR